VNNDFTNLFIGFDQAMFYSNNNVFLFVETSRKTGVTNLIGLGMASPAMRREWMGWDFLENLSFTNFAPRSMFAGDEFADGRVPEFYKARDGFERGAGVFWLDADLPTYQGFGFSSSIARASI